jgi:hypothetical protein
MGDTFSDEEFREFHRLVQTAALAAYPNPKRIGCPGSQVLKKVANTRPPFQHPAYQHVAECSPCLGEMLELRSEYVRRQRNKKRWMWIGVAAAAILIVAAVTANSRFHSGQVTYPAVSISGQVAVIDKTINLWDRDALRGGEQPAQLEAVLLPAAVVRIRVILPRFSESGQYTIAVTRDKNETNVLAKGAGQVVADGPREIVTVTLDLRKTPVGSYFLQTTRDQDEASYFYPLKIS